MQNPFTLTFGKSPLEPVERPLQTMGSSQLRNRQFLNYVVPILCTPWKKRIIQSTKWKDIIYGWR